MAGRNQAGRDRIVFSHAVHSDNGVACADCHGPVGEAQDLATLYAPRPENSCENCHSDQQSPLMDARTAPELGFSHKDHLARVATFLAAGGGAAADAAASTTAPGAAGTPGAPSSTTNEQAPAQPSEAPTGADKTGDGGGSESGATTAVSADAANDPKVCAVCHPDATTAAALPLQRPTMATCLTCHNHNADYAEARCTHCHPSLRQLPLMAVAEFEHTAGWITRHGLVSQHQGESCLQCHQQSSCSECHSRVAPDSPARLFPEVVDRTVLHRGDFISTHGMDARLSGDVCLRCHQTNQCQNCHRVMGLAAESGSLFVPHPAGYAMPGAGTRFHGDDARRNIHSCAACHDQGAASVCVQCHRVGGVGGSPHPAGWSKKNKESDIAGNALCLTCHAQ